MSKKVSSPRNSLPKKAVPSERVKAGDLDFYNLLRRQTEESRLFFNQRRAVIFDVAAMGALRQQLIETLGEELTTGILTRFGYVQGHSDAKMLEENFEWASEADWLMAGPILHMLEGIVHVVPQKMEFDRPTGYFHAQGLWSNSYEAEEHLRRYGPSDRPVCWTLTGYASGYATYFFGQDVLAIETECMGCGDAHCSWELRPVKDWDEQAAPYLKALEKVDISPLFQDISERRQADEVLRQQVQIIDQTHDAIISTDLAGYVKSWNKGAERLFGYSAEAMLFRHFTFLFPETEHEFLQGQVLALLAKKEKHEAEVRMRRSSGEDFYAHLSLSLLHNSEGSPTGMVGYFIDITGRKQAEETLLKRAIELEAVTQMSTAASTILETQTLLQTVVDLAKSSFNLYHAQIYLLDETDDTLVLTAGTDEVGRQMVAEGWQIPLERKDSLVARAARTQQGIIANDVTQEPNFLPNPRLPETRAEAAVPMMVGDRVLGILDVQADRVNRFTREDIRLKTILATQVAVALQNANLFEQTQQARLLLGERVRELDCLNDIGREAEETPPVPEFLQWVTERIPLAMQYPDECRVAIEFDGQIYGQIEAIRLPQQMVHGLRVGSELVGRIYVSYTRKQDFINEESMLLGGAARRVGAYIENRRLFSQTQEALAEMERLYNAGRRINATQDLPEILAAVAEVGATPLINRALIFIFERNGLDEVEAMRVIANWHSGQGTLPSPIGRRYPRDTFSTVELMLSSEPLFFNDVQHDERMDGPIVAVSQEQNIRAMAVLPLQVGGRQLGVLLLEGEEVHEFTQREIQPYLSLAPQVAVAIENKRLLEQAQLRAQREQSLREVTTRIRGLADVDTIMRTTAQEVGRALGRQTFIYLGNGNDLSAAAEKEEM